MAILTNMVAVSIVSLMPIIDASITTNPSLIPCFRFRLKYLKLFSYFGLNFTILRGSEVEFYSKIPFYIFTKLTNYLSTIYYMYINKFVGPYLCQQ